MQRSLKVLAPSHKSIPNSEPQTPSQPEHQVISGYRDGELCQYVARFTHVESLGSGGWFQAKCPLPGCEDEGTGFAFFDDGSEQASFQCFECERSGGLEDFKAFKEAVGVISIFSPNLQKEFGENRPNLPLKTVEEVLQEAGESADWLVKNILARGALTDFSGLAKRGGKTTFWCHAIAAGARGEDHAGFATKPTKYLYLTEQGNNFAEALRDAGLEELTDYIKVIQFKDVTGVQWDELMEAAGEDAQALGFDAILVDTFAVFARLKASEENDAGVIGDRMRVLRLIAQTYDNGVALIRHSGKDGTPRGSSAFEAEADICITLSRPEGRHAPSVRRIAGIGRYGMWERNIQLHEGRYISLGSDDRVEFRRAVRFAKAILPESPENGMTKREMLDRRQGEDEAIAARTLDRAVAWLVEQGEIGEKQLMNKAGKPKVYWLAYKPPGDSGENENILVLARVLLTLKSWARMNPRAKPKGQTHAYPRRRGCESDRSEFQIPPLLQKLPVSELITEGKPTIFREAVDVELLVVHELGGAPLPDVRLQVAQVFRREDEVPNSVVGGFVLVRFHGRRWERSVAAVCTHLPGGHFSVVEWPYCRMGNLPDAWKSYERGPRHDRPSAWNRPGTPVHTAPLRWPQPQGYPVPPRRVPENRGGGMNTAPVPIVGVSLGHRHERTAISVTERAFVSTGERFNHVSYDERGWERHQTREHLSTQYAVRHLERHGPPSRYSSVAGRVPEILRELGRESILVVDITATGRPAYSLILGELSHALEGTSLRFKHCPITVSGVAGGVSTSPDVGQIVPRRDLISATQILFDEGQLKKAEGLSLAATLRDELLAFKPKADKPDDLEGWRERPHDDLVLAVAVSLWAAERFLRKRDSVPVGVVGAS
jgi:hypothetical protein